MPAFDFCAHIGGRLLDPSPDRLGRKLEQPRKNVLLMQCVIDVSVYFLNNLFRGVWGRDQSEPCYRFKAR
jgi:hypothetical protein